MRSAESRGEDAVNENQSDKNRETDHSDKDTYNHIMNAKEVIDPVAIRKKRLVIINRVMAHFDTII